MNHSSTRLSFIVFIALIAGSTHVRAQEIWCSIWSTSADRPSGMYALDASAADTAFTLLKLCSRATRLVSAPRHASLSTFSPLRLAWAG